MCLLDAPRWVPRAAAGADVELPLQARGLGVELGEIQLHLVAHRHVVLDVLLGCLHMLPARLSNEGELRSHKLTLGVVGDIPQQQLQRLPL